MTRVAIFIDDFSATGVVVNSIAIARRLLERGCVVQMIASQAEGALIGTVPEGVTVVGLLPADKAGSARPGRLRRSLPEFRRRLREFAPDVLFSAGNHGHLASALASLGLPKCRIIVRISNDLDHMIDGKPVKPYSRWWRILKFRTVAMFADKLVFVSPHLVRSEKVLGKGGIRKAVVIPNGVDARVVRERAKHEVSHEWLSSTAEQPLVLAVGRLAGQKNFENLLRAIAHARRSRPLRLLLIGSGPLESALREQAAALGIAQDVDFMAPVPNPIPFIAGASVLALPSWWEGSSNVLLEALACGTPIVASRTAGSAEDVLDHGRYGVLVDPGDPVAMGEGLLRQIGGDVRLPGDRALAFSRDAALDAYVDLILREELAPSGGSRA